MEISTLLSRLIRPSNGVLLESNAPRGEVPLRIPEASQIAQRVMIPNDVTGLPVEKGLQLRNNTYDSEAFTLGHRIVVLCLRKR